MTDEAILRKIFNRFYFSSIFAILCGCLGQIVGNIIVGNSLGEEKLAVASLVLPIYYVFATIGNLVGIGGSAVCAQLIGKRRTEECKKAFTVTCLLTYGASLIFTVIFLIFLPQIIGFLGTPAQLYDDTYKYALIMVIGGMFTAGVYISFNMLRLDGKVVATTLTFVIMVVLNVSLDFALMRFGMTGVSIATVAGAFGASLFGILLLSGKSETLGFTKVSFREIADYTKQIVKVGSPGATENGSILVKSYFFNRIIVTLIGASALSSLSVVNSVNSFAQSITIGCAGAIVPLVSVFSAERDTVSMRRMLKAAFTVSLLILAVFCSAAFIFAPEIAGIFGISSGLGQASSAIRLFVVSLPFSLAANMLIYLHLSNSHTLISNVLTAVHSGAFPILTAAGLIAGFGSLGLWISFAAVELLTLLTALVLHLVARRKNRDLSPVLLIDTKYEKSGKIFDYCCKDTEEGISEALEALEAFCDESDFLPKRAMLVNLSMDEMMHLAAKYSTPESKYHMISLRILYHKDDSSDVLIMRLRYDGRIFNPIAYYEEKKGDTTDIDSMLALADMLGMKLVTDTCDVVDYRTTFGINNLTIIV